MKLQINDPARAAFYLMLCVFALVCASAFSNSDAYRCKYPSKKENQTGTDHQVASEVAAPSAINSVEYKKYCAETNEGKQNELCQNWRAANAAEDQACMAHLQFWLNALGLFGLLGTVIYTAKAAYGARDAAIAAEKAIEADMTTERAVIHVSVHPDLNNTSILPVRFTNYGKSPAFPIEWSYDGEIRPFRDIERKNATMVIDGEVIMPDAKPYTRKCMFQQGGGTSFVVGHLIYKDIFGVRRKRAFAFSVVRPYLDARTVGGDGYNYDRPEKDENDPQSK